MTGKGPSPRLSHCRQADGSTKETVLNWEMVGALGEVGGAIAVVITLVYLARQIRDSAHQSRRTQSGQLEHELVRLSSDLSRDPDLAGIWLQGLRDPDALEPSDSIRLGAWLVGRMRVQEALFHFHREGGVHDYQLESWSAAAEDIMKSPGARAWWSDRRGWFSPAFRAEVDRWIEDGGAGITTRYDVDGTLDS